MVRNQTLACPLWDRVERRIGVMGEQIPGESYRARAAEIRALAEQAKMPENRDELLALAARYERLAKQIVRLAGPP